MTTTLTIKGQVTIPKQIRDALGLQPGMPVHFDLSESGDVVLRRSPGAGKRSVKDRFEQVRGAAGRAWRTDDLMQLLRKPD
jgi:antitoxin PrlF